MSAPPTFGRAPGLACSRWINGGPCGAAPIEHVLWNWDGDNGIVCEAHALELGTLWAYVDHHPYNPLCSIGGAEWTHERCIVLNVPGAAA